MVLCLISRTFEVVGERRVCGVVWVSVGWRGGGLGCVGEDMLIMKIPLQAVIVRVVKNRKGVEKGGVGGRL